MVGRNSKDRTASESERILEDALALKAISVSEGLFLYERGPLPYLIYYADLIRKMLHPGDRAGWIIDRNINITNVCFSQCSFCNFCRRKNSEEAYVTTFDEYRQKIVELFALGGDQVLLQGGMNPDLGLSFYTDLFSRLKKEFPALKLHALGPPEIVYLAGKEKLSFRRVLTELVGAGLDSLPGAGAEILSDRVRKILSPHKATTGEWLDVMREAHRLNLPTSATMMAGHIETPEERIMHLKLLRDLQAEKPEGSYGFITFVPWPFQDKNTRLSRESGIVNSMVNTDYIRLIAISRLMLNNIRNIQASLLTVGRDTAMMSLHAGANDLGSVMIEENVVSSAGVTTILGAEEIRSVISEAGFIPVRRNQKYEPVE
ncbi:MAG: CofH family radical SAM protein [Bacteroidales bacterium]|nr:CofH family radical SAM protein [Bacteroidales bacterium]